MQRSRIQQFQLALIARSTISLVGVLGGTAACSSVHMHRAAPAPHPVDESCPRPDPTDDQAAAIALAHLKMESGAEEVDVLKSRGKYSVLIVYGDSPGNHSLVIIDQCGRVERVVAGH